MPYTSATAVLNTAVLRRLRAARAVEDAVGLLLASATFSVTMAGMLLAVSEGEQDFSGVQLTCRRLLLEADCAHDTRVRLGRHHDHLLYGQVCRYDCYCNSRQVCGYRSPRPSRGSHPTSATCSGSRRRTLPGSRLQRILRGRSRHILTAGRRGTSAMQRLRARELSMGESVC